MGVGLWLIEAMLSMRSRIEAIRCQTFIQRTTTVISGTGKPQERQQALRGRRDIPFALPRLQGSEESDSSLCTCSVMCKTPFLGPKLPRLTASGLGYHYPPTPPPILFAFASALERGFLYHRISATPKPCTPKS